MRIGRKQTLLLSLAGVGILALLAWWLVAPRIGWLPRRLPAPGERTIRFPNDTDYGRIRIRNWNTTDNRWEQIGFARGDVLIPAGKEVWLTSDVSVWQAPSRETIWKDMLRKLGIIDQKVNPPPRAAGGTTQPAATVYERLRPNDLQGMTLSQKHTGRQCDYSPIRKLTGLRMLEIYSPSFGDRDMKHLRRLRRLERLVLSGSAITDTGLRSIRNLRALEVLALRSTNINGTGLRHLAKCRKLRDLHLSSTKLDDNGAASLARLPAVRTLNLMRTKITDEGLAHLARLESLEELWLSATDVDGPGLRHLRGVPIKRLTIDAQDHELDLRCLEGLQSLEVLSLYSSPIDDAALESVGQLKAIRTLNLKETNVTGPGLAHLHALSELRQLDLSGVPVGDENMEVLAALPNLTILDLSGTKITDDGLLKLGRSPSLRMLNLANTTIGDRGLATLKEIPYLYEVNLRGTKITDAGLVHLYGVGAGRSVSVRVGDTAVTEEGKARLKKRSRASFISVGR